MFNFKIAKSLYFLPLLLWLLLAVPASAALLGGGQS
jgi:hypothetical protein